MRLSLSFLGTEQAQIPPPETYGNSGVEAVLLDRKHLEDEAWAASWRNISQAVNMYGSHNLTFHFPMEGCDYVEDDFVRDRLYEGYGRAGELDLAGVVVHSNRIRTADEWRRFDVIAEQERVAELLTDVRSTDESGKTWLGLENMPVVGNYGYETDPLFATADDLLCIPSNLGVVWDICHASSSRQYIEALKNGVLPDSIFARDVDVAGLDPRSVGERIVHWHFSAYNGLNNPDAGSVCTEGLLPTEADEPVEVFEATLRQVLALTGTTKAINFEVQESDYSDRERGPAIIDWAEQTLSLQ